MPARTSSLIDPAIGHLAALARRDVTGEQPILLPVLARVCDPRHAGECVTGIAAALRYHARRPSRPPCGQS